MAIGEAPLNGLDQSLSGCVRNGVGSDPDGQERRQKVVGYQIFWGHMTYEHENEHVGIESTDLPRLGLFLMQCVVLCFKVWAHNIEHHDLTRWNLMHKLFRGVYYSLALWEASFSEKGLLLTNMGFSWYFKFSVLTSWGALLSVQATFYPEEARIKGATVSEVCKLYGTLY